MSSSCPCIVCNGSGFATDSYIPRKISKINRKGKWTVLYQKISCGACNGSGIQVEDSYLDNMIKMFNANVKLKRRISFKNNSNYNRAKKAQVATRTVPQERRKKKKAFAATSTAHQEHRTKNSASAATRSDPKERIKTKRASSAAARTAHQEHKTKNSASATTRSDPKEHTRKMKRASSAAARLAPQERRGKNNASVTTRSDPRERRKMKRASSATMRSVPQERRKVKRVSTEVLTRMLKLLEHEMGRKAMRIEEVTLAGRSKKKSKNVAKENSIVGFLIFLDGGEEVQTHFQAEV